jgi:hypothetical protein
LRNNQAEASSSLMPKNSMLRLVAVAWSGVDRRFNISEAEFGANIDPEQHLWAQYFLETRYF